MKTLPEETGSLILIQPTLSPHVDIVGVSRGQFARFGPQLTG
jgi:hypothetical protein